MDAQFVLKGFDLKAKCRLAQVEKPSAPTEMKGFSEVLEPCKPLSTEEGDELAMGVRVKSYEQAEIEGHFETVKEIIRWVIEYNGPSTLYEMRKITGKEG